MNRLILIRLLFLIMPTISSSGQSVTNEPITTSSEVTDLSGITHMGSGKIISDAERTVINNLSGIDINANYTELPIATTDISGGIIVGDTLDINNGILDNISYYAGDSIDLSGTTFSINTNDLSKNLSIIFFMII